MKHTIIYKNKSRYSSFPLLTKLDDRILIGFFTAPIPDHMGLFLWSVWESFDQGETWHVSRKSKSYSGWEWASNSPRERSDRFTLEVGDSKIATGSYGFKVNRDIRDSEAISKSTSLFYRNYAHLIHQRNYEIPNVDIILTFPRPLQTDNLILIPAYAIMKGTGKSRCFTWRSNDGGKSFRLWNMFSDGVDGNEMAFINTDNGILAHIRSDKHPYLLESWSEDEIIWSYPTKVYSIDKNGMGSNIIGGPPHLLRLKDGRILCSYGYRLQRMGIRAIVSENEGMTWSAPKILREDGGYVSSLHKRKWRNKFKLPSAGNDIGYPVSVQIDDESILTAYYITGVDRITGIEVTKWRV